MRGPVEEFLLQARRYDTWSAFTARIAAAVRSAAVSTSAAPRAAPRAAVAPEATPA